MVAVSILFPVLAADAQSPEKPWQHADGQVEFQGRFFPDYDTSVVVYQGACGSLVQVACDDDSCQPDGPLYTSRILDLPLEAGSYYIRVGGYQASSGTAIFNLEFEE